MMWAKLINGLKKVNQSKALILMYHQVNHRKSDPWDLAVHPDRFESQLNFLKNNFDIIPLEHLVSEVNGGSVRRNSLAITFDDGFIDNYENAIPLLEWYKIPATFYFTTRQFDEQFSYWWEDLEGIVLHSLFLPEVLSIKIGNVDFSYQLRREKRLTSRSIHDISSWRFGSPFTNERIDLYLKLWKLIQPLRAHEQDSVMRELRLWASYSQRAKGVGGVMTEHQVRKVSMSGLFSIGAHTVNHAMLGLQSSEDQFYEISESKQRLESLLGKKVSGFAYPYGHFTETTRKLVDKAGFRYAVSTKEDAVVEGMDLLSLPRVQVKNWCVSEFAFNIKNRLR